MCIYRNDWFDKIDKIMFYGCGYFGNNFEIVILINRYFKII